MKLSQNAIRVLEARYLRRDSNRRIIETPEELFQRVAKSIAYTELLLGKPKETMYWEEQFFGMLSSLDFLPNSPTLMNAGTPLGQLSACFVLPVEDTMEDIFEAIKQMALIQRTGGGTGFSFSRLRPKGSVVASTGGESSGPVSFMKIFDCATEYIKQGGKRRGANMGVLRVDHPDILEFITAKLEEGTLRNFNLSVGITDHFMEALKKDTKYELINPQTKKTVRKVKAKEVFDKITESAWASGDPGLLFLDTINKKHPLCEIGEIEATNPCGELPLLPYESCNLGSINLSNMIEEKNNKTSINWEKLKSTVHKAVRFLDNVIEVNKFPLPQTESVTKNNRKIGLGVMGFAEMLIKLGVPYDSEKAVKIAEKVMSFIHQEAVKTSMELAEERGVFPNWHRSTYFRERRKMRNATVTSIAPTGTISIIAGTTSGIEPMFALAYRRTHVLENQSLVEINPIFLDYLREYRLYSDALVEELVEKGTLKDVKGIPEYLKSLFVTALEIPYEQHIKIQAAFQKHVDNSVSKTINMPQEATVDDVKKAYLLAYELGCKGITVFRYGSRREQVLELGAKEEVFEKEYFSKCDPHACKL
ncbi:MAG: ribonucleotide-diphosphate reductase subunit alpha [Deltaproteobacteria bacterium]|jgi:ribonucleoside-diphosphate reductase alpha chain|nr:MAG: ribonucleotide-diphosphate reductase subunit alpha [Deltaproteobacteria bacterium]